MFLMLKENGFGVLNVIGRAKTRTEVIKWHKNNGDDEVLVFKADTIKDFIKKSE